MRRLLLLALLTTSAFAQTPAKPHPAILAHPHFSDGAPILALPANTSIGGFCSSEGSVFLQTYPAASPNMPDLYSVSAAGELKGVPRKLPVGYSNVMVRYVFAGEHTLVTLLEADQNDTTVGATAPREVRYFLSISDHDGDHAGLLLLDLNFKPLRVAAFGDGDFLVLGWDTGNNLPLLVQLKDDGAIRRFVDLDERHSTRPYGSSPLTLTDAETTAHASLSTLEHAHFAPYGSEVLLSFEDAAKDIRVLGPVGEDRTIPIAYPPGFLLQSVVVSYERGPLLLRLKMQQTAKLPAASDDNTMRLMEFNSHNGSLLREFQFAQPPIGSVLCAPPQQLIAIFHRKVTDPTAVAAQSIGDATIIATAPR